MDELEMKQNEEQTVETATNEVPLDKNLRLMSPTMMVVRRFFRSKLSIVGMVMVIALFLFSFVGPLFLSELPTTETVGGVEIEVFTPNNGKWGETELDASGKVTIGVPVPVKYKDEATGIEYTVYQTLETEYQYNSLAAPSKDHLLGTDDQGYDVFVRLMYGGRISLIVSFLSVFLVTIFGIILGGIAGYYGGAVDTAIMRICDVLMCLPGIPIMLIISTALDSPQYGIPAEYRIYLLMAFLSLISWPGGARLVRGQILSLREQEFMVAAEAMGYSTSRKIFKHLIPNVMPQLIVSMTLSLGSMILYEATLSYLNMGVKAPYAAWGTMINIISTNQDILQNYPNVWVPAGVCIVIAVLGFNFVGDGLRDALDPKARR